MGNALAFRSSPIDFLQGLVTNYGDLSRFKLLNTPVVMLNHPRHAAHVLQEDRVHYNRDSAIYKMAKPMFGDGLVIMAGGESWLQRRRLVQPAFHRGRIEALGTTMTQATGAMLDAWDARGMRDPAPVADIGEEMGKLALTVVVRALFALTAPEDLMHEFAEAALAANEEIYAFVRFPLLPLRFPTPGHLRFWRNLSRMNRIIHRAIREHSRDEHDDGDLLSMLVRAQDEQTGARMNRRQLRDELMGIFFAGHDTTASALTWLWYLLARHPEVERRLHEEVDRVLAGRTPTMADLPNLPYTRAVMDETLRLYPPAWQIFRHVIEDDEIDGYRVPAGADVLISPYFLHRHPDFWPDADRFDPDRFTPEQTATRDRLSYLPFGAGARMCVGSVFAQTEIQLILASVAQRYRLVGTTKEPMAPAAMMTLGTGSPLRLRLRRRGR